MIFNSLTFIFIFLPIFLLIYYNTKNKYKNIVLLLFSLIFYGWNNFSYVLLLMGSITINFLFGKLIEQNNKSRKFFLGFAVITNIAFLMYFKYTNFFIESYNQLSRNNIALQNIILPIGISFYTFQAISYQIEVYKRSVKANKNFINLTVYIGMFPQLSAGPIVRYNQIYKQIENRGNINLNNFYEGIQRFILGLSKKVLIADNLGVKTDLIFDQVVSGIDSPTAWIGMLSYSFQIFFDFSGYSDMAIGIAQMIGYKLPENFNYPYISKSLKEFWQRWHISLSSYFRDYLYIPLGGNRNKRTYLNLLIVFLVTGFWHGPRWTFIIWGIWHWIFNVIEKILAKKNLLDKFPKIIRMLTTFLIVSLGFIIFRAVDIETAKLYFLSLIGLGENAGGFYTYEYFLSNDMIILLILSIIFSTPLFNILRNKGKNNAIFQLIYNIVLIIIFILSISVVITSTYSPFIYSRF
ncbi:MAG: MBOAT family protein [Tissierellia bacterium]|nr:MBOAT family protein [Tissierellia bacterium]